jgi:hypothetical protein
MTTNKTQIKLILINQIIDSKNKEEIIKALRDGICFVENNLEDFNVFPHRISSTRAVERNRKERSNSLYGEKGCNNKIKKGVKKDGRRRRI